MEVYILDDLYRRVTVIEKFESLIWTERYSAYGDFEMDVFSTLENRNQFVTGTLLCLQGSYRIMVVETIEDTTDDNGVALIKLTGNSLEAILDSRFARSNMTDNTTDLPKWLLDGPPADICGDMYRDICIYGVVDVADIIPNITEGSIFPAGTIPFPDTSINYAVDPSTLYAAIQTLCVTYLMGFRFVRNFETSEIHFDVYMGSDRTLHQTVSPPVVFSPDLGNLQNTSQLKSIAPYKNVAYVLSPVGTEIVYALEANSSTSGFDRKVLFINADDITDTDPDVASAQMIQRGNEQLALSRKILVFDGEVTEASSYLYGRDYGLGDLVSLKSIDGDTNDMLVTEQIFVSDAQGDRSYPTLVQGQEITPGSWLALPPSEAWEDVPDDQTWSNQ